MTYGLGPSSIPVPIRYRPRLDSPRNTMNNVRGGFAGSARIAFSFSLAASETYSASSATRPPSG